MNIRKLFYVFLFFALSTIIADARVRYTDEMKGYIGTWTHTNNLGDISAYRICVSDGWVVVLYKFEDHFSDGTYYEGALNEKRTIDYTFQNGKFYFDRDYPRAYNSVTLELKEGSLIETIQQRGRDDKGREYSRTWSVVYELDF